jgi:hypothetical protein
MMSNNAYREQVDGAMSVEIDQIGEKRQIRGQIRALPPRSVLLAEDETNLLLFPLLRSGLALRGQVAEVRLSGWNARRVIFGAMNLRTGHRLFLA